MKHFAVIGNPIAHSLSPVMHTAAIEALQLDADYTRVKLEIDQFDLEIRRFLASEIDGFNVTVPFKEKIIPYLDQIDPFAAKCGAVNTVKRSDTGWTGYNTDGYGFLEGLEEKRPLSIDDRILIIGAGGASKGIYLALSEKCEAPITVTNRTLEKAEQMLAAERSDRAISLEEAEARLAEFTIIIQTTSVGLDQTHFDLPLSLESLKKRYTGCGYYLQSA